MKKRTVYVAWMLTPAVVCAGAFLLAWLGASVGGRLTGWTGLIVYLRDRKLPEKS
jgi:hypothetical protein